MTTKNHDHHPSNNLALIPLAIMIDRLDDMINRAIRLKDELEDLGALITDGGHLSEDDVSTILTYFNEVCDR